ncbi:MAG: metal-dependent hydrolase [Myxococcota bacterium]
MVEVLEIRRPELSFATPIAASDAEALPAHWHGDGAFATHFYDALSSTFPFGEAFFVRSVTAYRNRIDDPCLSERIRGFAGQEGQHSRLHDDHVELLVARGYPRLASRNRFIDRLLRIHNRRLPRLSLASTAALEHLTAILARRLLEDGAARTAKMHPKIAPLWRWHALEELEHKCVAHDVLMRVAPQRWLRIVAMSFETAILIFETSLRTGYMLWRDGLLFDRPTWRAGSRFLFGPSGLLRGTGAAYRAWFGRDFHPDSGDDACDDAATIAEIRPRVMREIAGAAGGGGGRACSRT